MDAARRRVLLRYVLFQLPGWTVAALAAAAAVHWWSVSATLAATFVALWIGKDFALFPWLRIAYEPGDAKPGSDLLGARAVADGPLTPSGYVRVRGELWRAELSVANPSVAAGSSVRVREVRGLTLVVEPDPLGS